MPFSYFQAYKLQGFAYVWFGETPVAFDLISLQLNWSINSIPGGSLTLAVGREVRTGLAANIHYTMESITTSMPVEVYLWVAMGPNSFGVPFEVWPEGYFRIFLGRITSIAYTRTRGQVGVQLGVQHWLGDLNFSSAMTRQAHSLTPQQMSTVAALGGGDGSTAAFTAETAAAAYLNAVTIGEDLWGSALRPFLLDVCGQDVLSDEADPMPNFEAVGALSRFEPLAESGYTYGVPLTIDGLDSAGALAEAIETDVSLETYESMVSTTLWDKIVGGYAANYRFAVVPLVESALAVPYVSGNFNPWQTIYAEEYESVQAVSELPRPIRGVRLFTNASSTVGAVGLNLGEAAAASGLGGTYVNPLLPGGMMIYENAPRWAANAAMPDSEEFSPDPTDVGGTAIFPGAGSDPAETPADKRAAAANVWDNYARAVYIVASLRGRSRTLRGKLRFDIAPGSTVELMGVEDRFVAAQTTGAGGIVYGEVVTVTVDISADGDTPSASTSFAIGNVRTAYENLSDATSIDKNPLYLDMWNGAPLVDLPEFVPIIPNPVFPL